MMDLAELLEGCFRAGVAAVEPRSRVSTALAGRLSPPSGKVIVLGLGKAAAGMAWGVSDAAPVEVEGVIVTDHPAEAPSGVEVLVGDHPVPTAASVVAGEALLENAHRVGPDDLAVVLISGGGSALAEAPLAGVSLTELQHTTDLMLRSGAPIDEINTVRTHLSRLKGGGLAAALSGVPSITLIVSDVVGDNLEVIASGPMSSPSTSADDAVAVLSSRRLIDAVPPTIVAALRRGEDVRRANSDQIQIVASRVDAARGARHCAVAIGLDAAVLDTELTGEAAPAAARLATTAHSPAVAVFAGETTVTVTGDGRGGRNHEAALAAAIAIAGDATIVFLAAGTDGIDGSAGGAGAVVDGATVVTADGRGIDAQRYLDRHDSGGFFDVVPGRIVTGSTGTNVGDIWLVGRR